MSKILITGTSSGIGLATAIALGRSGHTVMATMRNPDRGSALREVVEKGTPADHNPEDGRRLGRIC